MATGDDAFDGRGVWPEFPDILLVARTAKPFVHEQINMLTRFMTNPTAFS